MAMSNGVAHTKSTTIRAEDFDGQLTEFRKLGSDGIDGTEYRTEQLVSAGRRRMSLSNRVEYTKYLRIRSGRRAPGDGCMGKHQRLAHLAEIRRGNLSKDLSSEAMR